MGSDQELIAETLQGDHAAFRAIVERYESQVAATVIGMLGPGSDAEDVGQETFVRLYQALDRFRGDSSLGTYLTRIAINLSLNASKRRQRLRDRFWSRDRDDDPPPEPALDGQAVVDEESRRTAVQQGIQRLKPEHRAVVLMRMIQGYSTKETAELLGIPEGTVLSRLSRGMNALKSLLPKEIATDEE